MFALHLLAPLALTLSTTSTPAPPAFTQLVVFGDSLSDNGNFFAATGAPPAPYWSGRFSNGPVWVEQMANHLGLAPGAVGDHAVGFATTSDVLQSQVAPYLAAVGSADPGALYVYWAGGNDLFGLIDTPGGDPTAVIGAAMQATSDALLALLGSGARDILVVNLPDLSATPLIVEFADRTLSNSVLQLTLAYNGALAQTLGALEVATGADFLELDAFGLTSALVADPHAGGFRVVDQRALAATGVVSPHEELFLFWDHVHPTRRGHSFVMGAALGELGILWGDVNGDGVLGSRDQAVLARSFGPCGPGTPADLDGNAVVDQEDLLLLRILLQ